MDSKRYEQRSSALSLEEILAVWLPARIEAIQDMLWILDLYERFGSTAPIKISIADGPEVNSNIAMIGNPMVAAGYLHARALLEFMGLTAANGKLSQVKRRRSSDVAIEHYSVDGQALTKVTLEEAYLAINMPRPVVEWALVAIIETANKLLAHITTGEVLSMAMNHQVRIAFEGVPILLQNHLFAKVVLSEKSAIEAHGSYSCNSSRRELRRIR